MVRHSPITIPTDFRDGEQKKYQSLHVCIHGFGASARGTVNFEFKRGATIRVATGWS
jgi:hypothetical protein